jgi:hypothetical protein
MASLEDRAKELALQRQREREAADRKRREQEERWAADWRRAEGLAQEFVPIAIKYGLKPVSLYSGVTREGSKSKGINFIGDVWVVRSFRKGSAGWRDQPGVAITTKAEILSYDLRDGILVKNDGRPPYGGHDTSHLITQAAAIVIEGEQISP